VKPSWANSITGGLAASMLLVALSACRTGRNYPNPCGPRYAGGPASPGEVRQSNPAALRIVSFNLEFGRFVDRAVGVLTSDTALRGADVVLLQEMDQEGTRRIAQALDLWYVYYPAVFRYKTQRQFGNAGLSWRTKKLSCPTSPGSFAASGLQLRQRSEWEEPWCGSIQFILAPWRGFLLAIGGINSVLS
jgi:hypothetical protein